MAKISRLHVDGCDGGNCSCVWRLDYRPMGLSGPRKRIEFPTKKAAEKYLTATSHKVSRGEYVPPERVPTFAKVASEWLNGKQDYHPATVQSWRVHLRHLAPLDTLRLDRIDVAAVERVRDELRDHLSAKTVSAILTTAARSSNWHCDADMSLPTPQRSPSARAGPFWNWLATMKRRTLVAFALSGRTRC